MSDIATNLFESVPFEAIVKKGSLLTWRRWTLVIKFGNQVIFRGRYWTKKAVKNKIQEVITTSVTAMFN